MVCPSSSNSALNPALTGLMSVGGTARRLTTPCVQVNVDLRRQCDEKTVMKLLEEFALAKHTGLEKPGGTPTPRFQCWTLSVIVRFVNHRRCLGGGQVP